MLHQEHSVSSNEVNLYKPFLEQHHDLTYKSTHRTFLSSSLVKSNPMAIVTLVSHINQHVSFLAEQQVVERALVEEAENLRRRIW